MAFNPKDYYFKQAKKQHYLARSIFKLEEIHKKNRFFSKGDQVLDLGAAPGSWSQYACEQVGSNGKVLGIDLKSIKLTLPNAKFIQGDILQLDVEPLVTEYGFNPLFDVVMSDMAPKTTGVKATDQARSAELCMMALKQADLFLKKNGNFVCKFFQSDEFQEFRSEMKKRFKKIDFLKPKSTRKQSTEIFIIGLGKLHNPEESKVFYKSQDEENLENQN
ncbi:MAG: 50S rRNA methyltransferase [Bdellovibrionaceae bacterium]|nr:50S rRNA methyltransferase [Pseudobdellovibrionaceae bacterium]